MVNEDECIAAGLDPEAVRKIARRIERVARDAAKEGIMIFGGSGFGVLAPVDDRGRGARLRLADLEGGVWDGGDGGQRTDEAGLLVID